MRSFFNVIFFIIIVVCLAAPYATGFLIERRYNEMLAKLNAGYNGDVVFTGKFERGYFSSHATTTLSRDNAESVVLDQTIYHGPIVFKYSGWMKASNYKPQAFALAVIDTKLIGALADRITSIYQDNPAYNITTTVAFNGDSDTKITNYPLQVKMDNAAIEWRGFVADLNMAHDTADIDCSISAPFVQYIEAATPPNNSSRSMNRSLEVTNLKMDFKKTMANANELMSITIDQVTINDEVGHNYISVNAVAFKSDTSVINKLMSLDLGLAFNQLQINSHSVGPFTLEIKAKNLDMVAMQKITDETMSAQSEPTMTMPSGMSQTDATTMAMQKIPQAEIVEMLSSRPIFDVTLSCVMPSGNINYTNHLEIGGPGITSLDWDQIWTTAVLSKKLQISKPLLQKILLKYGQQNLLQNAEAYAMMNPNAVKNPYLSMTDDQRKNVLANWVLNLMHTLETKKMMIEQNNIISIDVEFQNNVLMINGMKTTQQDLQQIQQVLDIPVSSLPPEVPAAPSAAVPKNLTTTPPASTAPQTVPMTPAPNTTMPPVDGTPQPPTVTPVAPATPPNPASMPSNEMMPPVTSTPGIVEPMPGS